MSKKRGRDEEVEDLLERVSELQKELKRFKPVEEEHDQKTANSIERLTGRFNEILQDIIRDTGVVAKKVEEDLTQFIAYVDYPNEIDMDEIQSKLIGIDDGVAWITYETLQARELKLTISYTKNKALKMQYLAQEQREAQQLLHSAQADPPSSTAGKKIPTDADMVLFTLKSSLLIDTTQRPVIQCRSIGEKIQVVSVTIGVQSPLKSHQMSMVYAGQSRKIKTLRIGPHPTADTIRMIVEIYCSTSPPVDTTTTPLSSSS